MLSALRAAILDSETIDVLLRKALAIIDAAYNIDGILWVGVNASESEACRAYATVTSWNALVSVFFDSDKKGVGSIPSETQRRRNEDTVIRRFRPKVLPLWLEQQKKYPELTQLETGDLIVPVFECPPNDLPDVIPLFGGGVSPAEKRPPSSTYENPLQFVFQCRRRATNGNDIEIEADGNDEEQQPRVQTPWNSSTILSIQSTCYQLILACDALSWKRRLEQSQRHTSLLSRTAHMLNSSVHPDVAIKQILAEMGQSIRCDRTVLFDLRDQSVEILATWERPRHTLHPLSCDGLTFELWQDIIDLFLQGGASYVELKLNAPELEPLQLWLSDAGTRSALVLPIFIREEFFGAIALLSHRHDRTYVLDELQMVGQNTDQLAIALAMIQNSRSPGLIHDVVTRQVPPLNSVPLKDDLTDLPNRHALDQELEHLSTPSVWAFRAPFSLIVCDIDYFKLVNDVQGHEIGDKVLHWFAQRLQQQLRRNTLLFRYGGEEFAIILEDTELQAAKDVAERLCRSIRSAPLRTPTELLTITASFGVAQLETGGDRHALDVLHRAEEACFEAKRQGRDRVMTR